MAGEIKARLGRDDKLRRGSLLMETARSGEFCLFLFYLQCVHRPKNIIIAAQTFINGLANQALRAAQLNGILSSSSGPLCVYPGT